jgi:hypothetical protein
MAVLSHPIPPPRPRTWSCQTCRPAVYEYSFRVRPADEAAGKWLMALLETCDRLRRYFTEAEFNEFRQDLAGRGLLLKDITRVPYLRPQSEEVP